MRVLLDANLPRAAATLLRGYGVEVLDVRDLGMGAAKDEVIAAFAQRMACILVTRDFDFADIRNYPPEKYAGVLVVQVPDDATTPLILRVLASFFSQPDLVARLPGRLAILERHRIRFRPA